MFENLSLHTKVRRLGYLKLLVEQYLERDFLPVNTFNQYFEKLASDRSVLRQLEDNLDDLTIEHILPQKLTDQWKKS